MPGGFQGQAEEGSGQGWSPSRTRCRMYNRCSQGGGVGHGTGGSPPSSSHLSTRGFSTAPRANGWTTRRGVPASEPPSHGAGRTAAARRPASRAPNATSLAVLVSVPSAVALPQRHVRRSVSRSRSSRESSRFTERRRSPVSRRQRGEGGRPARRRKRDGVIPRRRWDGKIRTAEDRGTERRRQVDAQEAADPRRRGAGRPRSVVPVVRVPRVTIEATGRLDAHDVVR